jgi:hypothetical protein
MPDPEFWLTPIVGIPWCREEDYDAFVAIFEDAKDLPAAWQGFASAVEEAKEHYEAEGRSTIRVNIDPRTFSRWCESKGYRINAKARAQFAHDVANPKTEDDR